MSSPTNDPAALSHEDITARQRAFDRRRRLRLLVGIAAILTMLAGVGFGAKPALHAVKAWQARRLAAEGRRLMQQEKWLAARQKIGDASALWPLEPEALRVTAEFLNRVNNPGQALSFWKQLDALHALTPADQREFALSELGAGDLDAADARMALAWPKDTPGTPADWQAAMQLAMHREHAAETADLARRTLAAPASSERQRLTASAALLATARGEEQLPGWQAVMALAAGGKSPESLEALLALARVAAAGSKVAPVTGITLPSLAECITRIEAHPLAKATHRLFAMDLSLAQDPSRRDALIQSAIDRYHSSKDDADLAALASWLYSKGEYGRELAVIPADRASNDRTLFFQRLDALGALGRWADIRTAIQGKKFPLDAMTAQMYLARCAAQLGEPGVRDTAWQAALVAAGTDPGKLVTLGQYAMKNGAMDIAGKAIHAAVAAAPDSREANEALFQWLEAAGQSRELHDALAAYAPRHPRNASVRNDTAYFDALLNLDPRAARDTARELVRAEPGSLPHRVTLALAELRLGNGLAALDVFHDIALPPAASLLPRQRAVYAAVLWKASYERQAREVAHLVSPEQLLPEERELIRPILDAPAQ